MRILLMLAIFAHTEETGDTLSQSESLLSVIGHQPAPVAFLISVFVLLGWFGILSIFKLKLLTRLLAVLPAVLALALLFFSHNPLVASVLLSGGFVLVFVLSFTMLRAGH